MCVCVCVCACVRACMRVCMCVQIHTSVESHTQVLDNIKYCMGDHFGGFKFCGFGSLKNFEGLYFCGM